MHSSLLAALLAVASSSDDRLPVSGWAYSAIPSHNRTRFAGRLVSTADPVRPRYLESGECG